MRLIDADDVMRMLTIVDLSNGNIADAKTELRNVKTAYDVEKVVEEAKDCLNRLVIINASEKISEIIRKGGVE